MTLRAVAPAHPWGPAIARGPCRVLNFAYYPWALPANTWVAVCVRPDEDRALDLVVPAAITDDRANGPQDVGGTGWARPVTGWDIVRRLWPAMPVAPRRAEVVAVTRVMARTEHTWEPDHPWAVGPWCVWLADPVRLATPVPVRPHPYAWDLPPRALQQVREAFSQARSQP